MPLFPQFTGTSKPRQVNLSGRSSTLQAPNPEALLSKARDERRLRERHRLQTESVLLIQRVWRGRRVAAQVKEQLVLDLQGNGKGSFEDLNQYMRQGRALMLIYESINQWEDWSARDALLLQWMQQGVSKGKSRATNILPLKMVDQKEIEINSLIVLIKQTHTWLQDPWHHVQAFSSSSVDCSEPLL